MLRRMSWSLFQDWRDFDQVEPIGGVRGDWQAASICATLTTIAAARAGGGGRIFSPEEMLLKFKAKDVEVVKEPDAPAQSWQEQKMIGMMWAAASNADQRRRKRRK